MPTIEFFVPGKPVPKGSLKMRWSWKRRCKIMVPDSDRLNGWSKVARASALAAMVKTGARIAEHGVRVDVTAIFVLARPKAHFNKKGMRDTAPPFPTTKGLDVDKGVRAVLDAMTGIVYEDDSQVCHVSAAKTYKDNYEEDNEVGVKVEVEW